jgi:hypothetical protein
MSSPASRSAAPGGQGQPPHQNVPHIGQLGWLARSLRYDRALGSVVEACVALASVARDYSDPAGKRLYTEELGDASGSPHRRVPGKGRTRPQARRGSAPHAGRRHGMPPR